MGLLNKVWSGLDFWDKQENKQQRDQFKAQDEEKKRREAEARAQAQAQRQTRPTQTQQTNVSVSDVPRKPTTVTVDAPRQNQNLQVYKSATTPTVSVEKPTAEQVAHNNKIKELDTLRDQHMARATEEAKKRTSWFDRQFTNRNWTKDAEATAISRATRDYQDKYGWTNDKDVINYQAGARRAVDEGAKASTSQWIAPVISTARVGTGMAEGVGGLYDLATPGKGTNRFTQAANKKAVEQDQLAKDLDVEKAYKVGNVAGEILSYAVPGMIATKGAKALNTTGKVGKIAGKYGQYVDDIGRMLDKGGDAGKIRTFLANRVRQNFTIEEAIQELMITGRYMGQNTARGGDTSWQSIATDAAMGFAGGLLVPANAANRLFRSADGTASAQAVDDVAGSTIAGATEYLDNAIRNGADVPTVKPGLDVPEVPKGPPSIEVAPGVKSPNLVNNPVPDIPNPAQAPVPTPSVVPTNPNVTPPVQQPTTTPPVQQQLNLPEAPRVNEVPQYQPIEAPQKPVPMQQAPTPVQAIPEAAPVTTPIKEASQEAIANSTPAVVPQRVAPAPQAPIAPVKSGDEALDGLRASREDLAALRDAQAAEGLPTADLDRQIAAIDKQIASKVAKPTKEATVLAEGEKQYNEAKVKAKYDKKPEISKQEAPQKPSNGAPINDADALAESARKYKTISEWRDKTNTNLIDANGRMIDPVTGENISAKQFFDQANAAEPKGKKLKEEAIANAGEEVSPFLPKDAKADAPKQADSLYKDGAGVTRKTSTGEALTSAEAKAEGITQPKPKKMTQAEKDQLEIDRANAVRKAEGSELLPSKPAKDTKTVAPEKTDVAQSEPTPVKPTRAELQKGAAENVTKSGKVTAAWKRQALADAGTDAKQLEAVRSAVQKVEGKTALPSKPTKVPEEMAGGIASADTQGVSVSGDLIDKTSKAAAEKLGKAKAKATDADTFLKEMADLESKKGGFTQAHYETAKELQTKVEYLSKEWHDLGTVMRKQGTQSAQGMSTRAREIRDVGTADEIVAHYINRVRDRTGVRLTPDDMADINRKIAREVETRTEMNRAQEAYYADTANPQKQKDAISAARQRDIARKEAMIEEMRTTARVNGGDRKTKKELTKLIDKLNKDADVWQMDFIDTSLLSTSGTWIANAVNSSMGAIEETLFGKIGAKIARGVTKTDVGGGNAYKLKSQKFGLRNLVQEATNRTQLPSKNPAGGFLNTLKNMVTTMNELGNTQIDAGAHASVSDEYRRILTREYPDKFGKKNLTGDTKKELDNLVEYNALVDPRDLRQKYIDYGFKVQGMAAVLGKAGKSRVAKLENQMADGISSLIRAGDKNPIPKPLADGIGKLTMRVTVGFPTIVARSAAQGARRLAGGTPTFLQAALTDDPTTKAMLIKQGVKELGSGVALVAGGAAAGQAGLITGSYPTDKTTQDEWAKEGKSEWSIKINGSYYGIPRLLGPFAIPFLVGAQLGDTSNNPDGGFFAGDLSGIATSVAKSLDATTPVSQMADNLETISDLFKGGEQAEKAIVKFGGNAARIGLIPLSGLLNQIAQSTTGEQKDVSQYDNPIEGILNKVYSGVPWVNHNLPNKTSKDGTVLKNTDPLARAMGAQSTENVEGVADNQKKVEENQNDLAPIINDKNIYDLLEPETQKLLDQTQDPKTKKRLNDQNFETIYKDVSKTTDKLASEGKWESYGSTLKVKLNTQKADIKETPEAKAVTERQIKQADILKANNVKKEIFALYNLSAEKGGISASDFKKMIDPEDEYYDMDTANALWKLDQLFTEAGVSGNNTGAIDPWTRQKYSMPKDKSGSGSGGSKDKGVGTDFGSLAAYAKPPSGSQAQKYQGINAGSPLPNLTAQSSKTNLRKNISVVKGVRL